MGRGSHPGGTAPASGAHISSRGAAAEERRVLSDLRGRLEFGWSKETSADPENWSEENLAYGQCAVTSLIVQDLLGGDLMRTTVDGVSHYFNRLPSGTEADLTFEQFPEGSSYDEEPVVRERSYVESHEPTMERYRELADALGEPDALDIADLERDLAFEAH